MSLLRPSSLKWALTAAFVAALAIGLSSAPSASARHVSRPGARAAQAVLAGAPLGPNDVSWLFPVPRNVRDLPNFIAIGELTAPAAKDASKRDPIWPAAAFKEFLEGANGPFTQVGAKHHLKLPPEVRDIKAWHVAGLRIDPGAPGLTPEIMAQFGQQPQLRFILQPVTRLSNGVTHIHDIAAHLIYSFNAGVDEGAQPGCSKRPKPDLDAFRKLARDFASLRDELRDGHFGGVKIDTSSQLLGVHPGLANRHAAKALRDALVKVLETHLSGARLSGMAVMGLADDGPEPWVFLAMAPVGPGGAFIPVPAPALNGKEFAEALAVLETPHQVIPTPAPNNLNPITCKHGALPEPGTSPVAERKGLATAELFDLGDARLTKRADIVKVQQTVDLIANTARSHFFNTDCVSCHTDTRRAIDLLNVKTISGVDPAFLPKDKWNVRNFGWFPASGQNGATVTRRTAAETQAVVNFINKNGLAKP